MFVSFVGAVVGTIVGAIVGATVDSRCGGSPAPFVPTHMSVYTPMCMPLHIIKPESQAPHVSGHAFRKSEAYEG